jgi:hypothetical protein
MPRPTQEQIDALKGKHGEDLELVCFDKRKEVFFVARTPTSTEYDRFMDRCAENAKQRPMALDELGRACAVFPEDAKERAAFFEKKPGATTTLATKALGLAGLDESSSEKL